MQLQLPTHAQSLRAQVGTVGQRLVRGGVVPSQDQLQVVLVRLLCCPGHQLGLVSLDEDDLSTQLHVHLVVNLQHSVYVESGQWGRYLIQDHPDTWRDGDQSRHNSIRSCCRLGHV